MMQTQTQPSRGLGVFTEPKTACTIWFKCLYIFLWKRKIHIRSCYLWAVKRWLFSLCHLFFFPIFPKFITMHIYLYIFIYICSLLSGKKVFLASNSIYIIPCSEACFHLNNFYCSGSFFFHTYRLYVQISVSRINGPIFRFLNFSLIFPLIVFLLISPKSGGNNNRDI